MIRVRLNRVPGVADQDFDCETEQQAREVLREYVTPGVATRMLRDGGVVSFRAGGSIEVVYGEEG